MSSLECNGWISTPIVLLQHGLYYKAVSSRFNLRPKISCFVVYYCYGVFLAKYMYGLLKLYGRSSYKKNDWGLEIKLKNTSGLKYYLTFRKVSELNFIFRHILLYNIIHLTWWTNNVLFWKFEILLQNRFSLQNLSHKGTRWTYNNWVYQVLEALNLMHLKSWISKWN